MDGSHEKQPTNHIQEGSNISGALNGSGAARISQGAASWTDLTRSSQPITSKKDRALVERWTIAEPCRSHKKQLHDHLGKRGSGGERDPVVTSNHAGLCPGGADSRRREEEAGERVGVVTALVPP